MFEEKQTITDAVEALMTLASRFDRGQHIAWVDIEAIAGNRFDDQARYVIVKWRKRLEKEREIVTLVSANVGVRLLTHRETAAEIPALRQRKAYRQIRRALKQTSTVNATALTDQERRLLAAQRSNMALQRRDLYRSRQELKRGVVATETNPRRKSA